VVAASAVGGAGGWGEDKGRAEDKGKGEDDDLIGILIVVAISTSTWFA
jgi:hypothetical protein